MDSVVRMCRLGTSGGPFDDRLSPNNERACESIDFARQACFSVAGNAFVIEAGATILSCTLTVSGHPADGDRALPLYSAIQRS